MVDAFLVIHERIELRLLLLLVYLLWLVRGLQVCELVGVWNGLVLMRKLLHLLHI